MREVYISGTSQALPGPPVSNDQIATRLGVLDKKSEKLGRFVLRQNKITNRHYTLQPDGTQSILNAELAALAVQNALSKAGKTVADMGLLSTATSQGDILVPGHASAVHAMLDAPPVEIANFQSVCASAVMSLKCAWLNVGAGMTDLAVTAGSDNPSRWFRPSVYEPALQTLEDKTARMSAEFLRWTLSDGAGAAVLSHERPQHGGLGFRIDGISITSFANEFDTCMYVGLPAKEPRSLKENWSMYPDLASAAGDGAMLLLQDMSLLKPMFRSWVSGMRKLADENWFDPNTTDWMLCHHSAASLRDEFMILLDEAGVLIDPTKWWSNLPLAGNTGAAAFNILLDGFLSSGEPKRGDKVFCLIPESGRGLVGYVLLTVV